MKTERDGGWAEIPLVVGGRGNEVFSGAFHTQADFSGFGQAKRRIQGCRKSAFLSPSGVASTRHRRKIGS